MELKTAHKAVGIEIAEYDKVCSTLVSKTRWIDEDGDWITVDFDKQPPWCDIKDEGDYIFIPPFYTKTSYDPPAVWVSAKRLKGFRLHSAFKHPETKHGIRLLKDPVPMTISEMREKGISLNLGHRANHAVNTLAQVELMLTHVLEGLVLRHEGQQ